MAFAPIQNISNLPNNFFEQVPATPTHRIADAQLSGSSAARRKMAAARFSAWTPRLGLRLREPQDLWFRWGFSSEMPKKRRPKTQQKRKGAQLAWRSAGLEVWRFGGLAWRFGGLEVWFGGSRNWWFKVVYHLPSRRRRGPNPQPTEADPSAADEIHFAPPYRFPGMIRILIVNANNGFSMVAKRCRFRLSTVW